MFARSHENIRPWNELINWAYFKINKKALKSNEKLISGNVEWILQTKKSILALSFDMKMKTVRFTQIIWKYFLNMYKYWALIFTFSIREIKTEPI